MTLVTKYQISAINSYRKKCDKKYLGRMISCLDFFLSDEPLVCSEVVHNEGLMHNSGHYDILSTFCIPDFCKGFSI
jgi:hypothetical protein